MNDEYLKKLYGWIKSNDSSYGGKFSYEQFSNKMEDGAYAEKMHGWVKGIDPTFFSLDEFNSKIKKKSQAENGGSTSAVGSLELQKPEDYTYGDNKSAYRKQGNQWLISNESTKGNYVAIKDPTGSRAKELEKNAVKKDNKFISKETKKEYQLEDNNFSEVNPEKQKALRELNAMKYAPPKPGPMGHGSMPAFSAEEIKIKEDEYNNIPSRINLEDDNKIKALNKQFGKNASLDEYYETFDNYDNSPEKKDNKYRIKNNSWERLVPGATGWSSIENEGSISALNRRYGKNIEAKKAIVVKPKEIDPFLKVNSNFLAQSEESAQEMLEKNFKGMGFTFEQTGVGGDYIKVTPNNGAEPQTFSFNNVGNAIRKAFSSPTGMGIRLISNLDILFDNINSKELEKNADQAVKLQSYLRLNASTENEDDLSAVNRIKNNVSTREKKYDLSPLEKNNKYYDSEDYKNAFKELTFQQKREEIKRRRSENANLSASYGKGVLGDIYTSVFGEDEKYYKTEKDLKKFKNKLNSSEEYKLFVSEQKKYDEQQGQKYDKLHDEWVIAKQSGNKDYIKTVKAKIEGGYSKDLIGDNLNHMTNTQYDLQRDINNFNKRKEKLQLDAKNGNLTQEQYNDAVEGLSSEAQRLDVAAKNVAATQKKMDALAGVYVTEKAKSGGFFGNFTNSLLVSVDELISSDGLSGKKQRQQDEIEIKSQDITPQQRQYYKDKGYNDEQIKNVFINNAQKNAIAANKRTIIETFGSDLTTEESKQNLGFVEQALVGVAASLPSMALSLIPVVGQAAAFGGMANMSYNAINEMMLNDADFETTSEADRAIVAIPYAIVMGALEKVGMNKMLKGESTIGKIVLSRIAKIIPKGATREVIENIANKEVKSLVAKGALKVIGGTLAEAETGALQAGLLDFGLLSLFNALDPLDLKLTNKEGLTGGEAFETPDTKAGVAMSILEGSAAEAIGGFAMSTVMVGAQKLINGKISLYNEEDLKFFEDFTSDQEFKKLIVSNLKTEMLNGTMTKGEAQSALNDINLVEGVFNSIDENISDEAKVIAFNLINERNRLEKEVIGKDPALSKEKNDRIKDINDKLGTLPLQVLYTNNIERATELETALKQRNNKAGTVTIDGKKIPRVEAQTELNKINQKIEDAVQKQEASQVPVQPTTAVGEEVVQREPTTEPQGLTEEGKAEEIKKALENLDNKSWSEISILKEPNLTKAINEIEALNLPFEEHNKRITEVYQQYKEEAGASVEEAYHKAKKDGSNPELVKAVEELLMPTTESKAEEVAPLTLEEELQLLAKEQAKVEQVSDTKADLEKELNRPYKLLTTEAEKKKEYNRISGDFSKIRELVSKAVDIIKRLDTVKGKELKDKVLNEYFALRSEMDKLTAIDEKFMDKLQVDIYSDGQYNYKRVEDKYLDMYSEANRYENKIAAKYKELAAVESPVVEAPIVEATPRLTQSEIDAVEKEINQKDNISSSSLGEDGNRKSITAYIGEREISYTKDEIKQINEIEKRLPTKQEGDIDVNWEQRYKEQLVVYKSVLQRYLNELKASVVKTEATPQEKVATYRAEEQAELLKAIPKIESYKVKGKIDKTKMPRTVLAKYNKIYEKYDALISPLLEPVVKAKAPVVKAEAPKAKGELPVMSWSKVEEYDDAVIRSMKEIQYGKLKPLRDLGKRTTVAQKEEIRTIEAKIATAERILDRRANKIKKEAQRVEKEGKGATVRAVDNNGTEAEYSVVVSKDGATAKVQLKKIGTLTPKRATTEANLTIQTDENKKRFVETKNKTKVYIDEAITPAKVEPTKAKVTSKAKVEAAPVKKETEIEKAIAEERLFLESMIEDGAVGFDKDLKLLNSNPYKYADEKNKKFSRKDKNGRFLYPEMRDKYVEFYLTISGRITAPVTKVKAEPLVEPKAEPVKEEAKAEPVKKEVKAEPVKEETEAEKISRGAEMLKNMSEDERDNFLDDWYEDRIPRESLPGGNMARNLYEAKKLVPNPTSKPKRTSIDNAFSLSMDQGFVINIDGVVYGLNKYEDPDATSDATDKYGEPKQYVWAYTDMSKGDEVIETWHSDIDELINEIKSSKKAEPVKEEAPAPAKKSTENLMGVINSIKEEIDEITEDIKNLKTKARNEVNKIEEEKLETTNKSKLEDLNDEITVIEDDLEKALIEPQKELDGKIKELKEEVKKIEDLDAKNPENKKTLIKYIDSAIATLNGLNKLSYVKIDLGVTVATLKLILEGIRAGVILTGDIKGSIRAMASKYRGEHKNEKITIAEFTKEIEEYLRNTFVDQKTNEQDIQETRDKFVEIREAVRKAKVAVKTESKALRANAENAIREMLKGKVKNLSAVQMKSIMLRLARFNVFSQSQYDKFIDYVDKVIGIADYDAKVDKANTNRKNAKKNLPKLGDISSDLLDPLSRVLNINAKLIPKDVFESYSEIVEMLSKRDAILELNKRADLNESLDKIIESIESNEQRVSDLKDLYDNFAGKTADYAKTLDEMLKVGIINQSEHELMKTFKSKIQGPKVKDKMTEQQIADEKAELINEINNTTITLDEIVGDEFRLERDLVKKLQALLKNKKTLESLNNKDLKDLLRVIDNINNGFVSNATQEMVEKLNFIEKSILLESSIPENFKSIARKINQTLTKIISKDKFGINVAPLFNIDQQLGDFKTKNIFNSVFNESAKAQQGYQSAITLIQDELSNIERGIETSFKNEPNKIILSQFKMMVYMMQLEYDSNPSKQEGSKKQVHQAMKTLDKTIEFAKQNSEKSGYNDLDIAQMESIKEQFAKDGEIDIDKLYNSFNEAEKNGLKKLQEINDRMTKFATYTATVINGKKIVPLKNYISYTVINESDILSASETTDQINNINANMTPGTVSKNLEERDGEAHPVYLNPFYATNSSSRSVLLNYHMTEPVRTARKTLKNAKTLLEEKKETTKDQYDILNAITEAYNTATRDLLESNFNQSNAALEFFKKQGYRAMLASGTRAAAEISSNIAFVLTNNSFDMKRGFSKEIGRIKAVERKDIMTILKSNVISRLYPQSSINSAFVELTTNANRSSRGKKTKTEVENVAAQVWDSTAKKYVLMPVAGIADFLISKPDQAVMRPLWFGSFSRAFEKEAGVKPDFDKIMKNDEEYLDKYKDALEKATTVADKQITSAGSSMNSYMGVLQNVIRQEDIGAGIVKLKEFNRFMNKFTVQEYYTAREGVRALVGNGSISRAEGRKVLAAVTLRMTIYSVFTRLFAEGMLAVLGYGGDDDDEKTAGQKISQGILSTVTTLVFGRYFGNFIRTAENYFIEKANKAYGEEIGLRDGEYDPYKDAIQFNQLQEGKIDEFTDIFKVIAGPLSPVIGLGDLGIKLLKPQPKTERAKLTRAKEWYRLGLEAGGIAGVVPFYKDLRKIALAEVYKELKKETKKEAEDKEVRETKTALTDSQKISSLKEMMNSGEYTREGIKKELRKIKDPEYRKALKDKDDAIRKKILDKYGYENLTDFKRNDEDNYEIHFGEYSPYRIKREESARIASELEKRVNALEDGEEYYPTDGAAIVVPKKKVNKYNRYKSVQNNNLPDFYSKSYKKY